MSDWIKDYLAVPVVRAERSVSDAKAESTPIRNALLYSADKIVSLPVRSVCTASEYKKYAGGE